MNPSLEEKLENIPTAPGVYKYFDQSGKIIYVGKAKNLRNRVKSYFQTNRPRDAKTQSLVHHIDNVELIQTDTEMEALILENNLIKEFKPKYNINLKDDKTFPYIVITNEDFPRIFPTRKIKKDGSTYFGPYTNVGVMRSTLKLIKDLFMVRSCHLPLTEENIAAKKWRVCLDYHIKKCQAPCVGFQSKEDYRQMINQVVQLINGKTSTLKKILREEMELKSEAMLFEDAALLRDRLSGLELYESKQKVVHSDLGDRDVFGFAFTNEDAACVIFQVREGKIIGSHHFYLDKIDEELKDEQIETFLYQYYENNPYIPSEIILQGFEHDWQGLTSYLKQQGSKKVEIIIPKIGDKLKLLELSVKNAAHLLDDLILQKQKRIQEFVPHSVKALQRDLRLKTLPRRIECFDNSNIQGSDPVAAMICFYDGKPKKSDYRRFNVKTVEGPDDFASMLEIVHRRYAGSLSEELPLPDLIVIDGGKGQLSHAVEAIKGTKAEHIPIIGLAKKLEEVFFPGDKDSYNLPKTSSGLKILQQARDEAHRFAITFHREKRDNRTLTTELLDIPTIAEGKAKKLLLALGSVDGVRQSGLEKLTELVGKKSAESILNYFETKEK